MAKNTKVLFSTDLLRKPIFWLIVVTLLGGYFRFYNLNWDFKHSFHPDERNILGQTAGIQPSTGYRVTFFAYGQLPVYLYRATGELVSTPMFINNFFPGRDGLAQGCYWALLAFVVLLVCWSFSSKKLEHYTFPAASVIFSSFLLLKLFPIFKIWFGVVDGFPLKVTSFVLVAVVSVGISAFLSELLGEEWIGLPLYCAAGATLVLGIVPSFFMDALSKVICAMAFTLLTAGLALWWAWVSKWGRLILSLFAVWGLFSSFQHMGRVYTGYGECMLIGRWWAALFSTATILVVYFFVRNAYQKTGLALFAAAGFAFAVVSIEQTHYCITESMITLMLMVVAYSAYQLSQEGSWRNYLLAGAAFGLSMASKTSSLYYVLILVAAHLVLLSRKNAQQWKREDKLADRDIFNILAAALLAAVFAAFAGVGYKLHFVLRDLFWMTPSFATGLWLALFGLLTFLGGFFAIWGITQFRVLRAQMPQWIKLASAIGLAVFLFCLFSPWSLLDYQGFMNSQNYEWETVSLAGACYVIQFKDTLRYIFHLQNLMSVELWWPLGIAAVAGMFWVLGKFLLGLVRPIKSGYLLPVPFTTNKGFAFSLPDLLILVWFIPYFGFIGAWNTKFVRYMVPLIPVFCIFAARFVTDISEWAKAKLPSGQWLKPLLATVVIGSSLFYSIAYMHVYRYLHPWIESSVWIFKNIPAGSMILKEAWDDGLPTGVDNSIDPRVPGAMGPQNYRQQDMTIYELHGFPTDDTPVKKNYYANILQQGEYISIASKKLWYTLTNCTPEFKPTGYNVYPVTSRYYRLLWSGLLGYKMVGEFHNFPGLFDWSHPDDTAEESFSVYDHPRVYIFKKVELVPPERIIQMLSTDDYVKGITRDIMRDINPDNVDAFIAERQKYLQEKGLLTQLGDTTPVKPVVAQAQSDRAPPAVVPAADSTSPGNPLSASNDTPATPPANPPVSVAPPNATTLETLDHYAKEPVIENTVNTTRPDTEFAGYQLRAWGTWVLLLMVLGLLTLPFTLRLLPILSGGAYSLSKALGLLTFAWLVWILVQFHLFRFTLASCWVSLLFLAALSAWSYYRDQVRIKNAWKQWKRQWLIQEAAFLGAFVLFTVVKFYVANIHDPNGEGYNGGGEAGMDYGFLASIVRGDTFPAQNMWMAGQPLQYSYYFGHLVMGVLTKSLGLVPAITYNLALITLFATIFSGAFGVALGLSGSLTSGWIAGLLCALAGNPAGIKQVLYDLQQCVAVHNLSPFFGMTYDFFWPSRVIPGSYNEFPYFSVLYGDMHPHTLAQPFGILFIAIIAGLYAAKPIEAFSLKAKHLVPAVALVPVAAVAFLTHSWFFLLPVLLAMAAVLRWAFPDSWSSILLYGFLLGSFAFLNTWEAPIWLGFIALVQLLKSLSTLGSKVVVRGICYLLAVFPLALVLLGWWAFHEHVYDPLFLGGEFRYFKWFAAGGVVVSLVVLLSDRVTRPMGRHLIAIGLYLGFILVLARILWAPFFFDFVPQQSEAIWVLPHIRTTLSAFLYIYGFFLMAILLSSAYVHSKSLQSWITFKPKPMDLYDCINGVADTVRRYIQPADPVRGMVALGLASLLIIAGASWVHWTIPVDKVWISLLFATTGAILFALAVLFRARVEFWFGLIGLFLAWMVAWASQVITLPSDIFLPMGLGLFTLLWLAAFFHIGIAVKTRGDRKLSYSYLLIGLFFLLLAGIEVFAVKEYLGGDLMRTNTVFKFGIVAWELAAICAGVFFPKVFKVFKDLVAAPKKETDYFRMVMGLFAGLMVFIPVRLFTSTFLDDSASQLVLLMDLVFLAAALGWGYYTGKLSPVWAGVLGVLGAPFFMLPMFQSSLGLLLDIFRHWGGVFAVDFFFPAAISLAVVGSVLFLNERQKNVGRELAFKTWKMVVVMLLVMVSLYPILASKRKAHWFWSDFKQHPTLNGLAYIVSESPFDGAAIRFLNERIPGQPCLVEFVGMGYNTWGSRFSIFTGIPALMGWDGHVREWLTGRPGSEAAISERFNATELIFRTTDIAQAKKALDDHGVRLVMVGSVERHGAPGVRGPYPPEGLAKFANFLPLIYKNPEVEIYYNPPGSVVVQ